MPVMQCARPSVCGVAPLLMLSGTDIDMLRQVHEPGVSVALGDVAPTSSGTRLASQQMGFIFDKGSAAVHSMLWRQAYAFALDASRPHLGRQELVEAAVHYAMSSHEARQRTDMGAAIGALEQRSPLVYRLLKHYLKVGF
jgi:hypothetical protein